MQSKADIELRLNREENKIGQKVFPVFFLCHQAGGALSVVQLCTERAPAGGYRNSKIPEASSSSSSSRDP